MATIGELLAAATARLRTAGSESARLDAELLLGWAIGGERTSVLAHPEAAVGTDAERQFEEGVVRRSAGEPVAYIRGLKEFAGLAFSVDRRALIPRPETEILVEAAEREIARRLISEPRPPGTPRLRVVDVGTGSGAIAVALTVLLRRRRMLPEVSILAADVSADALDLARENAVVHAVADAIEFAESDLLAGLPEPRGFDLVLANLPYVPSDEVGRLPVAASFEPRLALDGGPDGLDLVRRLLCQLPEALAPEGAALLEIGFGEDRAVRDAVAALPGGWTIETTPDLSRVPRVARVARAATDGRP